MGGISSTCLPLGGVERERIAAPTRDRVLVGLAAGGVALPPLVDLLWNGWERVFGYLAADSFYYFTVARNLASGAGVSFDGEYATNGFHPLWQLYTALFYAVTSLTGLGESAFLVGVFLSSLLLTALATVLLGSCFRLALGRVPAAFPDLACRALCAQHGLSPTPLWLPVELRQRDGNGGHPGGLRLGVALHGGARTRRLPCDRFAARCRPVDPAAQPTRSCSARRVPARRLRTARTVLAWPAAAGTRHRGRPIRVYVGRVSWLQLAERGIASPR
jgi:hypothetical protein